DGQPEPGAAQLARARLVDAIEALRDARQIGAGDADTRVAHAHLNAFEVGRAVRPYAHGDPAAFACVLDRVVDEVDEDLGETVVVGVHPEIGRLDVRDEPDAAGLGLRPHNVEHRAEHLSEAHGAQIAGVRPQRGGGDAGGVV